MTRNNAAADHSGRFAYDGLGRAFSMRRRVWGS